MRKIYKLIHMSFLYTGYDIFLSLYITFCGDLFQICINYSFSSSVLRFLINQSQTFINAYKLYFVLVHNVYIALENVELTPVLSSVFCCLLRFLEY